MLVLLHSLSDLRCSASIQAEARAAGKEPEKKKPVVVKFGLNHVTHLVETGKASLVVIAHDVDPIELVVWLPAVCRKMNVPYIIIKVGQTYCCREVLSLRSPSALATVSVISTVLSDDQPNTRIALAVPLLGIQVGGMGQFNKRSSLASEGNF